jgi:hypothetical protein
LKNLRIGRHVISWKLGVVLLVAGISTGVLAHHVWQTLIIPLEVKEPLEILYYPSKLGLYPGENLTFNITVLNHATVNYSVALNFGLSNSTYQSNYVTFSNEIYLVKPGQQNVTAWLAVLSDAPPANIWLVIDFARALPQPPAQENLYMSKLHVWFNTTSPTWAEAAFVLVNTGGRDVVLDKITCRSQTSDWSNVYYYRNASLTVTQDLTVTPTQLSGASYSHTIQGSSRTLTRASDDITLKSGWTIVIYLNNPDHVGQNDIGTPVAVTVYTAISFWSQECIVDVARGGLCEQITYTGYAWATPSGTTVSNITLTIKNTGPAELSVATVRVDGSSTGVTVKETSGATVTWPKAMAKCAEWSFVVSITGGFSRGTQYNFMVVTSKGNQFGPYVVTAP